MIHWGDDGGHLGRTMDIRGDDLPPSVQPLEGHLIYASATAFSPQRSRRQKSFRGPPPILVPGLSSDSLWGTKQPVTPSTPFLAPTLGPDAQAFLSNWRNRYGNRPVSNKEELRRQFFDTLTNPRYEHQPEFPQIPEETTDGTAVSPTHRFPRLDRLPSADDPVEIREIDLKPLENAISHHTNAFACVSNNPTPSLVLRRGQPFEIDVTFSRPYNAQRENLEVVMEIGSFPCESQGTRMTLPIRDAVPKSSSIAWDKTWWVGLKAGNSGTAASLQINIGSNAIVGNWTMKLVTTLKEKSPALDIMGSAQQSLKTMEYVYPIHNVKILFNPWCPDDQVFMDNSEDLNEYVLNDVGKIWRGCHNSVRPCAWVYGQFEDIVLEACMLLLDKCHLPLPSRASPIQLARTIAALVNSPDEDAIMEASWAGNYRGGMAPADWTGSVDILRRYVASGAPVKYGQCWNFAGLVCTLCRCLGIPCRVVTNYSSAHDSNTSVTVDYHVDTEGRPLKQLNADSVWNFHVWSDVWMSRPDLPHGYDGWQTIDGTPQEKSDGLYRCGPAPVAAVKSGSIGLGYDTAYVFSEVNSDKCYWLHAGRGLKFIRKDTKAIGKLMVSKKPGTKLEDFNEDLLDVTSDYKSNEDTTAERMAVMTALFTAGSHAAMAYGDDQKQMEDVECSLDMQEKALIGNDFHVTLRLTNKSSSARTVNVNMRLDTTLYMGNSPHKVKTEHMIVMVPPNSEATAQMSVRVREYMHRLQDQASFLITAMAHVKETGQLFITSDDFRLLKPDISIKFDGKARVGNAVKVHLELTNPISVQLTNCKFILDGPGFTEPKEISCRSVMPHGLAKVNTEVKPVKAGAQTLVAHFTSSQLSDVDGYLTTIVAS
jgi:transglutaminase 1